MVDSRTSSRHTSRKSGNTPAFLEYRWLPFAVGTVISFVIIGVLLILVFGGGKYDDAVKNHLRISYTHETALIDTLAPDCVWSDIAVKTSVDKAEFKEYLSKEAERYRDPICDEYGNDINIKFDIDKKKRLRGDELDAYRTKMASQYKIPETDIESACELTVTVTLNGSEKSATFEDVTLIAIKIGGEYYIDQSLAYAHTIAKDAQNAAQ